MEKGYRKPDFNDYFDYFHPPWITWIMIVLMIGCLILKFLE